MSRKRRSAEQALRIECRDLRYQSVYRDFSTLSDEDLLALTARVEQAYGRLNLVIDMRSREATLRLITTSGGVISFAIGVATTGGLLSILGVVIGGLGVGEGLFGMSKTRLQAMTDEQMLETLTNIRTALLDEGTRRGFRPKAAR